MQNHGRIRKEIEDLKQDKISGVSVVMDPSNSLHLTGTLKGPDDTPYAGGIFTVDIIIPDQYPFEPPKMKFMTKVWHPNISSQTGVICLDILKDQWSPALTIKTALLSLQALLCSPEPNDPQDAVVAKMYKEKNEEFKAHAKFWTETYASPNGSTEMPPSVRRLVDMGFVEEMVRKALLDANGDENAAIETLLNSLG